jgi:VWFA-related protein
LRTPLIRSISELASRTASTSTHGVLKTFGGGLVDCGCQRPGRKPVTRFPLSLAAALAAAVGVTAARQAAQAPPQQPPAEQTPRAAQPTFRSEANYIRVDAFVTRDGVPIEDLTRDDFEVLEDGVPQKIDAFEHVRIAPAGPQATRIEPNSQQLANQMAADPRARVFVVFLDIDHVPVEGSYRLKTAVATMLSRMLGQDDFIGMLTSRHSPSDLILARKTGFLEEQLEKYWYWGRKDTVHLDADEELYMGCYERYVGGEEVIAEMIQRRREKLALDALQDLVVHLRGLREERKAVLMVSAGWRLFRENQGLMRALVLKGDPNQTPRAPAPPSIGIGPGGRIMSGSNPELGGTRERCEQHRQELAHFDGWQTFLDLTQDANRGNVSFYPIDPRGLVVFDTPMSERRLPGLVADAAMLRTRQNALRSLADETDGLAVVNSNNLEAGLQRITADLTSYYLLGYYAPPTALDGKYHRITVRVTRPGARVRARSGYRAATREEITRGTTATPAPAPANNAASDALNRLALIRPDQTLFLHATHLPGGPLWVAGEIPSSVARTATWARGARVSVMALDASGNTVGVARREIKPGERDFLLSVPVDSTSVAPATVQVRAEPSGEGSPVGVEVSPRPGEPLLFRRSGPTPPKAAADFRYYRTEELVYRWPLARGETIGTARVLDRNAAPMPVPSAPSEQTVEGAGGTWMVGSVALAPLTNGDYLLELTKKGGSGPLTVLVPFRILR